MVVGGEIESSARGSSRDVGLIKLEAHVTDRLRLIEDHPDPLYAWRSSAPTRSCSEIENSFNRVAVGFRSDLNLGKVLEL